MTAERVYKWGTTDIVPTKKKRPRITELPGRILPLASSSQTKNQIVQKF
jgi:hypothetical protein